ncbi:MAG: RIP metalloprotease RseP [Geminocystis sp.]|nr:RIP metalloprotease RseP [Geminocystis sp.]HIK37150.1 RIP metalloprotease RseP [Geminocystis sp. M7585_C2015_104]MCS7147480.1 RIP metalloprotease RseP [Geminocystis sp.]MCX8077883.1 RIP metalloprotease RseP [Geminocystis sp.]MDW8115173.1 RIP metalloprotease RseP [Geminocystis sp.]
MSVLAAIAVLGILIVVHELGHFGAARLQGIHVNRFSIGFGPALFKYKGEETEYAIRAFPLGGYVAFPDDDPDSGIPADDPDLLRNRPIVDRVIVISAGVVANLIFAYFLLVGHVAINGIQEINYQQGVLIPQILDQPNSAAIAAGLQSGDVVLAVNNKPLPPQQEGMEKLRTIIQQSPNQTLQFTVKRGDEILYIPVTPTPGDKGEGRIGVMLAPNGEVVRRPARSFFEVLTTAADQFQNYTELTLNGFRQLLTNFQENANQLAGPVAIVAVGAELARDDLNSLLQFGALISINLAIINILPLPALDGGQLLFLLLEAIRGKPLPNKIQEGIVQTGLALLLGLGFFLILRDTANLAFVQKFLAN